MRQTVIALALAAATLSPVAASAQAEEDESLLDRGLRQLLDGLAEEVGPTLRDLDELGERMSPLLRDMQRALGDVVDDLSLFEPPEVLPNGDIILRRKDPERPPRSPQDLPAPLPDGAIDI